MEKIFSFFYCILNFERKKKEIFFCNSVIRVLIDRQQLLFYILYTIHDMIQASRMYKWSVRYYFWVWVSWCSFREICLKCLALVNPCIFNLSSFKHAFEALRIEQRKTMNSQECLHTHWILHGFSSECIPSCHGIKKGKKLG